MEHPALGPAQGAERPVQAVGDAGVEPPAEPADRPAHAARSSKACSATAARSCAPASPTARSGRRSGRAFPTWRRCSGERPLSRCRARWRACESWSSRTRRASSAASCSAISAPMWSRSNRPAASACRHVGPFLDDIPHPERSLSFWYYNTSKRGITLDLETADGRELFRRLAASAGCHSGNLPARLSGVARARLRSSARAEPRADPVRADPVRPDRPVAGLSVQRPAAHGGGRRDGLLRL